MLIDWFTVGAQAFNFLVLIWLLKRFLYRPVLNAIDARDQKIAAQLSEAAAKMTEAQASQDDFRSKNEEWEKQRQSRDEEASANSQALAKKLMEETRQQAEATRLQLAESLERDRQNWQKELQQRTQEEVLAIAAQVLSDLGNVSLNGQLVQVFLARLAQLPEAEKLALRSDSPARLRSNLELSPEEQKALSDALQDVARLEFEVAPETLVGLELVSNGQKLSWSGRDYLASLQNLLSGVKLGA